MPYDSLMYILQHDNKKMKIKKRPLHLNILYIS